jgi:hypothetical protein
VAGELDASCERERTLNSTFANCSEEKTASDGLIGANNVLDAYFKALTDVSNGDNFTIQPGLDAAAASFAKVPDISSDEVKAVSGLAGLFARSVNEGMREITLRDLIEQGAPKAQLVIKGMDDLIVSRLSRRLDTEQSQLGGQFVHWILAQGDRLSDIDTLCSGPQAAKLSGTSYLLALEYCRRSATISARKEALDNYQASLRDADKALVELESSKAKLTTKELAGSLYKIGSELNDDISEIKKAFD